MYAIGTLPLVHQLHSDDTKQVWFADDATAGGRVHQLHDWWTKLCKLGPSFGYFANPGKTWLIVKDDHLSTATELFAGTGVNITTEGKRHLGAAVGPRSFVTTYMQAKVNKWIAYINELAQIAKTQPHAAYSAFTHGLASKWTYFVQSPTLHTSCSPSRTPSGTSSFLLSLEEMGSVMPRGTCFLSQSA